MTSITSVTSMTSVLAKVFPCFSFYLSHFVNPCHNFFHIPIPLIEYSLGLALDCFSTHDQVQ